MPETTAADIGIALTAICWLVATVAALVVAVPQAMRWVLLRKSDDGLGAYRLKSVLVYGGGALVVLRNLVIYADFAFFDQAILGPAASRWPVDLTLALAVVCAYIYAAGLYLRERFGGAT